MSEYSPSYLLKEAIIGKYNYLRKKGMSHNEAKSKATRLVIPKSMHRSRSKSPVRPVRLTLAKPSDITPHRPSGPRPSHRTPRTHKSTAGTRKLKRRKFL